MHYVTSFLIKMSPRGDNASEKALRAVYLPILRQVTRSAPRCRLCVCFTDKAEEIFMLATWKGSSRGRAGGIHDFLSRSLDQLRRRGLIEDFSTRARALDVSTTEYHAAAVDQVLCAACARYVEAHPPMDEEACRDQFAVALSSMMLHSLCSNRAVIVREIRHWREKLAGKFIRAFGEKEAKDHIQDVLGRRSSSMDNFIRKEAGISLSRSRFSGRLTSWLRPGDLTILESARQEIRQASACRALLRKAVLRQSGLEIPIGERVLHGVYRLLNSRRPLVEEFIILHAAENMFSNPQPLAPPNSRRCRRFRIFFSSGRGQLAAMRSLAMRRFLGSLRREKNFRRLWILPVYSTDVAVEVACLDPLSVGQMTAFVASKLAGSPAWLRCDGVAESAFLRIADGRRLISPAGEGLFACYSRIFLKRLNLERGWTETERYLLCLAGLRVILNAFGMDAAGAQGLEWMQMRLAASGERTRLIPSAAKYVASIRRLGDSIFKRIPSGARMFGRRAPPVRGAQAILGDLARTLSPRAAQLVEGMDLEKRGRFVFSRVAHYFFLMLGLTWKEEILLLHLLRESLRDAKKMPRESCPPAGVGA